MIEVLYEYIALIPEIGLISISVLTGCFLAELVKQRIEKKEAGL